MPKKNRSRNKSSDKAERLYKEATPKTEAYKLFKRYNNEDLAGHFSGSRSSTKALLEKFGGIEKLECVERDAEVSAAIEKRKAALMNTRIQLSHKNPMAVKWFEEQTKPWESDIIEGIFMAIEYGYGVLQIIYNDDKSGRVIGYQVEDPWNFVPQEDLIHVELASERDELLPYGKWVLSTSNARASRPAGIGLYERLLAPYLLKAQTSDMWQVFLRRCAGGMLLAQTDSNEDEVLKEVRKMLDQAEKMGSIVTNEETNVTALEIGGDATAFQERDGVLARTVQKVVLGETQTTDQGVRGSSLSAKVHNEVRWEKTLADMIVVKRTYQMILNQIAYVAQIPEEFIPEVDVILDQGVDTERVDADVKLHGMGVRFKKEYFENTYGLNPNEFDVDNSSPQQGFLPFSLKGGHHPPARTVKEKEFSRERRQFSINDPDDIADLMVDSIALPIDPGDVAAAIESAVDAKDLKDKLLVLYDNTNLDFIEEFSQACYAAAASGALRGIPPNKKIEALPEKEQKEYM